MLHRNLEFKIRRSIVIRGSRGAFTSSDQPLAAHASLAQPGCDYDARVAQQNQGLSKHKGHAPTSEFRDAQTLQCGRVAPYEGGLSPNSCPGADLANQTHPEYQIQPTPPADDFTRVVHCTLLSSHMVLQGTISQAHAAVSISFQVFFYQHTFSRYIIQHLL